MRSKKTNFFLSFHAIAEKYHVCISQKKCEKQKSLKLKKKDGR